MKQLFDSLKLFACVISIVFFASCNSGTTTSETETTANSDSVGMSDMATDTSMKMADTSMKMAPETTSVPHAAVILSGVYPDTTVTGNAQFDAKNGKVKMKLELSIPSKANKSVAVHIHEMGDCGDMAKAAGGHWNPTGANHGKWGSSSFHSGDIGNVKLDSKGAGTMELETNLWSLGGDAKTNILGRTLMVHGGVDDFTTQPTGNAGGRIGCGVINK